MMTVELRVSFVQMRSVTKMQILFSNPIAIAPQRNDLAVLSNSFDRCTAALIRGSPIGRNVFGTGDLGEFFWYRSIRPSCFIRLSTEYDLKRIS
jgi:hypothetical protein